MCHDFWVPPRELRPLCTTFGEVSWFLKSNVLLLEDKLLLSHCPSWFMVPVATLGITGLYDHACFTWCCYQTQGFLHVRQAFYQLIYILALIQFGNIFYCGYHLLLFSCLSLFLSLIFPSVSMFAVTPLAERLANCILASSSSDICFWGCKCTSMFHTS